MTSPNPADRPFRVLGVQQIAVGGLDRQALRRLWIDQLGLTPAGEFRNETENVDGEIAQIGAGPSGVDLNLLEPIDPERSPRAHRPALNHIGLWVDDLEAAVGWLEEEGIRFTARGIRRGAAGYDVTFIDPRAGGEGVLIELVQAPPEVIGFADRARAEALSGASPAP
jgi:lactoylglutathione lyase